jgi:hypothetical protein
MKKSSPDVWKMWCWPGSGDRAASGFARQPADPSDSSSQLKHWGEYLIAVSIFSRLQYRITIERNVSQPEEAIQAAPIFTGLFEEKIWWS